MLDRAGMPWRRAHSPTARSVPIYDGSTLVIECMEGHDIVHDLAHWLTCTPYRRSIQNYGLGSDYKGGGSRRSTVTYRYGLREEVATCLVDMALLAKHGWDWRHQAGYYSIVGKRTLLATMQDNERAFALAIRRGVLTPDGKLAPSHQHL